MVSPPHHTATHGAGPSTHVAQSKSRTVRVQQFAPKQRRFGSHQVWVASDPCLRVRPGQAQQIGVGGEIRHAEWRQSGLPGSEHLARSAQAQVALRNLESIVTRADRRPTEGEPCFVQLSFRRLNDQEPRRRLAATVSWSRSSISVGWDGAGQHASVPLDIARTYLVVGKILASAAGPDQAFVRLYGTKDRLPLDEPLTWTVSSRPVVNRREFDMVQWSSMSEFGIAVDELRLGTNWSSVAEPYQQELELVAPASLRIPSSRTKGRPTVQID